MWILAAAGREKIGRARDLNLLGLHTMGRNIRETAIGEIGESTEVIFCGWANVVVQIVGHRACLVIRAREVVTEAARAGGPGDFRTDGLGAADCGDVGTRSWELRGELWYRITVIGLTGCTHALGCVSRLV